MRGSSRCSTTGRSDISNRLKKRNRKPPTCVGCRSKKLRCDRVLPSCTNCLTRPDIEHCDYSQPRDRCGSKRTCKKTANATTTTTTAQTTAGPSHQRNNAEADEDDDYDDHDGSQISETENNTEGTAERIMREKLERLERMIASLMESAACKKEACHAAKKQQKEDNDEKNAAGQMTGDDEPTRPLIGRRPSSESMWSNLLNEKIQKWQQGLSRYQASGQASTTSATDVAEKT